MYNLIFFVCFLLSGCTEKPSDIKIIWTNGFATGISIPENRITHASLAPDEHVAVRLITEHDRQAMLGDYAFKNHELVFEPLIPFTRGLRYEILVDGNVVGEVEIPKADSADAPMLIQLYPTQDSVPENLLKIYLQFSKPMREGVSAQHITVLKNSKDTLQGTFLDLQPELWNEDRTMLTLWLDPGRIKRDLIPNKTLGSPLQQGHHFIVIIDDRWTDTQVTALSEPYQKEFIVTSRDSLSPNPKAWIIDTPSSTTTTPLAINFNASLDYSLILSTLQLLDAQGEMISGKWEVGSEEKGIKFIPAEKWKAGNYELRIETRLEDLAGNNVNRLFDEDVSKKKREVSTDKTVSISLEIK